MNGGLPKQEKMGPSFRWDDNLERVYDNDKRQVLRLPFFLGTPPLAVGSPIQICITISTPNRCFAFVGPVMYEIIPSRRISLYPTQRVGSFTP
jgi:hypothetical protein